jgi:hypothetical protein
LLPRRRFRACPVIKRPQIVVGHVERADAVGRREFEFVIVEQRMDDDVQETSGKPTSGSKTAESRAWGARRTLRIAAGGASCGTQAGIGLSSQG